MPGEEDAVLAANEQFYRAFDARDNGAMESVWATRAPVACIHPGWAPLLGRELVLESWKRILDPETSPRIACSGASAHLLGDTAFVICTERLSDGELVATNLFTRESGAWKLVHHQAGPTPPPEDPPAAGTVH